MATLLCATVAAGTMADLRRLRDAETTADLVELRLDGVRDPDVAGALAGRRRPVIVTCRAAWEGGRFDGSEEERRAILRSALGHGAELVDVEWRAGFHDVIGAAPDRVVLSHHDVDATPADLGARYREMRRSGAAVVKLAVATPRLADVLPLYELSRLRAPGDRAVFVGMGPAGLLTRVLAARFGCAWTYAGTDAAIGQLTPCDMRHSWRFGEVSAACDLYGLAGRPVAHSLSPAMHNAAFRATRADALYVPFEAGSAAEFATVARALGVRGASVTTPFKRDLFAEVDDTDDVARRVGAVNTIRVESGRWSGTNTDVEGFLAPLEAVRAVSGLRAAVLGTGGAAAAVAVALVSRGASVTVHSREVARARELAARVGADAAAGPPRGGSWDLLVNATPVGLDDDRSPVPPDALAPTAGSPPGRRLVDDLIYGHRPTPLLVQARAAGCDTLDGLGMLVAQAERQFTWWTGASPPAGVFLEAATRALSARGDGQP
jgi:3-dehydroquinate dehydratase/shikimate dehydrogenase